MSQTQPKLPGLIHVIDDDVSIQASLTALLEAAGHQVVIYGTPAIVPTPIPHTTPSCILLDIEMPGGNGIELHRHLATQSNLPPVIYLTAHGDVPTSVASIKLGAVDFLQKPANPKQLLQVIALALDQDQQRLADLAAEDS
ncbi:MAG: response regulator transcription factor, partial [Planctomycetota bacterium]